MIFNGHREKGYETVVHNSYRAIVTVLALFFASRVLAENPSISLTVPQLEKLRSIVKSDSGAASQFKKLHETADAALDATPDPVEKIESEGKLASDPAKIHTSHSLADMHKLEALGFAYAVTTDRKYADKARQFILAWAQVNHYAGDPIDDTNLEGLIVAYDFTRSGFSEADRKVADGYLHAVAEKEQESAKKHGLKTHNNWHSHRLKIIGLIAYTLHDKPLTEYVAAAFKDQIDHNIHADGSTYDFHERDALHYHIYDLTPLLTLAIAGRNNGADLFGYHGADGGTLAKGIEFLLPYAKGEKQHGEFANSKVAFDRKRAAAGEKHFEAGKPFEPRASISALERAELFDTSLRPLVAKLSNGKSAKYPTWEIVLNDVRR